MESLDSLLADCVAAVEPRRQSEPECSQSRKRPRSNDCNFDNLAVSSFLKVGAWNDLPIPDHRTVNHASVILGLGCDCGHCTVELPSWKTVTNVTCCEKGASEPATQPSRTKTQRRRVVDVESDKDVARFLKIGAWNDLEKTPTHEQLVGAASFLGIGQQGSSGLKDLSSAVDSWSPAVEMLSENMSLKVVTIPGPSKAIALKKVGSGTKLYDGDNFGEISTDCITAVMKVSRKGEV